MRKFALTLLGLTSALLGGLIALPNQSILLRPLQVAINEIPWIPAILGGFTVLRARHKPRAPLAAGFGLAGFLLALLPISQYRWAVKDMDASMRRGLGKDYEKKIPKAVRARLPYRRWSFINALGGRERAVGAHLTRDIPYAQPSRRTLNLDVYQPVAPPPVGSTYPAIIVVHWGAWESGDKGGYFFAHNRYLAGQGYVVFDIQYRLSHEEKWPGQLEDVHNAVRWVKSHATEYHVNPHRIALMGRSAGGHLALMAAYCAAGEDTQVQAVLAIYAPTDLRLWRSFEGGVVANLLGGVSGDIPDIYAAASPVEAAQNGLPPTLYIEALRDEIVPYAHGESLANRLKATDTPHVMLRLPWSRHGFDAALFGLGGQLTQYYIDRFLAVTLYGDHAA